MKQQSIMKLTPLLVEKIWGGNRLGNGTKKIGESWQISLLKEGTSCFKNIPLNEVISSTDYFSFMVKFINTSDFLSVQVHPTAQYSKTSEKNEAWVVTEAQTGAGVYLGLKTGVDKNKFFESAKRSEDVSTFLNFYPAQKGDFFYVPAGTIHAIGAGLLLAEVQQSSGVTYRIWDWNRVDQNGHSRELHLTESRDVAIFDKKFNESLIDYRRSHIFNVIGIEKLITFSSIEVAILNLERDQLYKLNKTCKNFLGVTVLEGNVSILGNQIYKFESALVKFDDEKNLEILANENSSVLLVNNI